MVGLVATPCNYRRKIKYTPVHPAERRLEAWLAKVPPVQTSCVVPLATVHARKERAPGAN